MYPVRLRWRPALLRPTLRAVRVGTSARTKTERHTSFRSASWFSVASNAGPPCQRIKSFTRAHRAETTSVRASRRKLSYSFSLFCIVLRRVPLLIWSLARSGSHRSSSAHFSFCVLVTVPSLYLSSSCKKCSKMGHNPQTIALDPALFAKNVKQGGMTFTKKPRVKLSGRF